MIKERFKHLDRGASGRMEKPREANRFFAAVALVVFVTLPLFSAAALGQQPKSSRAGSNSRTGVRNPAVPRRAQPMNNPAAAFYRAVSLFNAEHYAEALKSFEALSANPQFLDLSYAYAARCLMKMEKFDDAQALIEQFNQRNPGNAMTSAIYDEIIESKRLRDLNSPALAVNRLADANPIAAAASTESSDVARLYDGRQLSAPVPPPTNLLARGSMKEEEAGVPPPTGFTADGKYIGSRDGSGSASSLGRPAGGRTIKPGSESLADQFSADRKLKGYDDLPEQSEPRKIDQAYAKLGAKGVRNTETMPSLGTGRTAAEQNTTEASASAAGNTPAWMTTSPPASSGANNSGAAQSSSNSASNPRDGAPLSSWRVPDPSPAKKQDLTGAVPPPTGLNNPDRSELSSSQKYNRAAPKPRQEFPEPVPGDSGPQGAPARPNGNGAKSQPGDLPALRGRDSSVDPSGTIPPAPAEQNASGQAGSLASLSPSGAISSPVAQTSGQELRSPNTSRPEIAMNRTAPGESSSSAQTNSSAVPPPTSLAGKSFVRSMESSLEALDADGQKRGSRQSSRASAPEPVLPAPMVDIQLPRPAVTAAPTTVVTYPMLIRNRSSAEEAFKLGISLKGDYGAIFVLDDNQDGRVQPTELTISVTPVLPSGGVASVILVLRVPKDAGGRQDFEITATPVIAQTTPYATLATLVVPALPPTLAVEVEFDHESVRRGRDFDYIVRILNEGAAAAHLVQLNYTVNSGYIMANGSPAWRSYDPAIRTAVWSFDQLPAGSTTTITIRLKLGRSAQPGQSVIGYGTLHAQAMAPITIGGAPVVIDERPAGPGVEVQAVFPNLSASPRTTSFLPFIVRNAGDRPDQFDLRVEPFAGMIIADTNRDGVYQNGERTISRTQELAPGAEMSILVKIDTPDKAGGQQEFAYRLIATSVNDKRVSSGGVCFLKLSVPRLTIERVVSTAQMSGDRMVYYTLTVKNAGDGDAKRISLIETLLPGNEFINADVRPVVTGGARGEAPRLQWGIDSLAPGASVTYRVAVRRNSNAEQPERANAIFFDAAGNQYVAQ